MDKIISILVALVALAIVCFSFAETNFSYTKDHRGVVISTVHTYSSSIFAQEVANDPAYDASIYELVIRKPDGSPTVVRCTSYTFKQHQVGDQVSYRTRYGRITHTELSSYDVR